jgi:hypothetical protein
MFADKLIQPAHLPIPIVGENKTRRLGNFYGKTIAARSFIRYGKQRKRRALLGFPNGFHGGDFGGLMLQRIQAVQISHEYLQRDQHRSGKNPGFQRQPRRGFMVAL